MLTERVKPAAITTPAHLVVAGGGTRLGAGLSTVEVLNLCDLQWTLGSSSPKALERPNLHLCSEHVYLSGDEKMFSCSVEDLLESCKKIASTSGSVWNRLTGIPVACSSTERICPCYRG